MYVLFSVGVLGDLGRFTAVGIFVGGMSRDGDGGGMDCSVVGVVAVVGTFLFISAAANDDGDGVVTVDTEIVVVDAGVDVSAVLICC